MFTLGSWSAALERLVVAERRDQSVNGKALRLLTLELLHEKVGMPLGIAVQHMAWTAAQKEKLKKKEEETQQEQREEGGKKKEGMWGHLKERVGGEKAGECMEELAEEGVHSVEELQRLPSARADFWQHLLSSYPPWLQAPTNKQNKCDALFCHEPN